MHDSLKVLKNLSNESTLGSAFFYENLGEVFDEFNEGFGVGGAGGFGAAGGLEIGLVAAKRIIQEPN